jgi:hypothetical protein|eukprot:COSAG05_NODE_1499_length_4704_cov_20.545284_2_plen_89_part_00
MIILPRQARDKHRERTLKKEVMRLRFSQTGNSKLLLQEFEARCRRLKESSAGGKAAQPQVEPKVGPKVRKTTFLLEFPYVCPEPVLAK